MVQNPGNHYWLPVEPSHRQGLEGPCPPQNEVQVGVPWNLTPPRCHNDFAPQCVQSLQILPVELVARQNIGRANPRKKANCRPRVHSAIEEPSARGARPRPFIRSGLTSRTAARTGSTFTQAIRSVINSCSK